MKKLVALSVLFACRSGPDLTTVDGGDLTGVDVHPCESCGTTVTDFAFDEKHEVVVGVAANDSELGRVDFETRSYTTLFAPNGNATIQVAAAAGSYAFATCGNSGTACTFGALPAGADASSVTLATWPNDPQGTLFSTPVGLTYDGTTMIAAFASINQTTTQNQPENDQWPGSSSQTQPAPGMIVSVQGTTAKTIISDASFAPTLLDHAIARDATHVYWIDNAIQNDSLMAVRSANLDGTNEQTFATVAKSVGRADNPTGIAALGSTIAFAAAPPMLANDAPECFIWTSVGGATPTLVLHDTTRRCLGLALDTQYVYFTIVRIDVASQSSGQQNSGQPIVIGLSVARIPIAGGAMQTVDVASQRYYGPRRILVDDTYVYAADPQIVLRFAKTDFQ